jgi:hypothetical protein
MDQVAINSPEVMTAFLLNDTADHPLRVAVAV